MSELRTSGISRHGLEAVFVQEEAFKSNLLLRARLLREQAQEQEAALLFAQAAAIEERLGAQCLERGLEEKASVHLFSAASCWAQAGNFYQAILLCERLLATPHLPQRLADRVRTSLSTIQRRRAEWVAAWLQPAPETELVSP